MLTYSFENRNGMSLYEYLYTCIKEDILSFRLAPDEKLPSKRALAKNLDISTITVESAYGQLMAEGYIYSVPKSGFYVSHIAASGSITEKNEEPFSDRKKNSEEAFFIASAGTDMIQQSSRCAERVSMAQGMYRMARPPGDSVGASIACPPKIGDFRIKSDN